MQPSAETGYSYRDLTAPAGEIAYRIKQVDRDGKFTYSNVTTVIVPLSALKVYPNPTAGKVTITNVSAGDVLKLTNLAGQLILTRQGSDEVDMDLSAFPSGIYFLTSQNQPTRIKIVRR